MKKLLLVITFAASICINASEQNLNDAELRKSILMKKLQDAKFMQNIWHAGQAISEISFIATIFKGGMLYADKLSKRDNLPLQSYIGLGLSSLFFVSFSKKAALNQAYYKGAERVVSQELDDQDLIEKSTLLKIQMEDEKTQRIVHDKDGKEITLFNLDLLNQYNANADNLRHNDGAKKVYEQVKEDAKTANKQNNIWLYGSGFGLLATGAHYYFGGK